MHCLPIAERVIVAVVVARCVSAVAAVDVVAAVAVVGRQPAVLWLRWPADNAAT